MTRVLTLWSLAWLALCGSAHAQLLRCVSDSPERRGEPGCTIIGDKRLPAPPQQPVLWHIDEFETQAAAERAAGPTSVAFTAHGSNWLTTVESDTSSHHGGRHRAVVGPLPIQSGRPYSMMVMSAYFMPGNFSGVHTHSGPEAWYVVQGEQCLETTTTTIRAGAGQGSIVPAGETMRMLATGTSPRRSLVLILHDAEHPATTTITEDAPPLKSCK
jgi:quercetin dioxygenase-like cupin family protein